MFCSKCGTQNPDASKFCKKCGNPLIQQTAVHSYVNIPKSSKLQCPTCGSMITDLNSPYCPKCLQVINPDAFKKKNMEKRDDKNLLTESTKIMRFEGVNGQIELFKDKIIIKRAGVFAVLTQGFTKGEKSIYLSQISGIQLKLGGYLLNGYIQFTLPGGNENLGGLLAAGSDENSVQFYMQSNDSAIKLKDKIEELVHKSRQSTNQTVQISSADEIKKFKHLLDEGIITQDEFNKKKKELLGL